MTTNTESKVSSLIDRHIATSTAKDDPSDADALFAELDAEDDSAFRAARAQQLASELSKLRSTAHNVSNGAEDYTTLRSDEEVLRFTTENEKCVLHFLHPDFARCGIMDAHLRTLSQRHAGYGGSGPGEMVKFGRVDVQDATFVVEKLGVRVLPAVIGFVDGVAKGRIVGFEGVSWRGKEEGLTVTREIEKVMLGWAVLERMLLMESEGVIGEDVDTEEERERSRPDGRRGIRERNPKINDDDDDWD